jgi:hypothetical protein
MVVYHIMCLSGLCVGVSWFSLLCFTAVVHIFYKYHFTDKGNISLENIHWNITAHQWRTQDFFSGFNKFRRGQRAESTWIWGR